MIDKTENEKKAVVEAGKAGGEYLDEKGRYDISRMTPKQYDQFIECVVSAYTDYLLNIRIPQPTRTGKSSEQLPF